MKATSLMGRDTLTFQAISQTQAAVCGAVPAYQFQNHPTGEAAALSHQAFTDIIR
jgi:hypothetical protein